MTLNELKNFIQPDTVVTLTSGMSRYSTTVSELLESFTEVFDKTTVFNLRQHPRFLKVGQEGIALIKSYESLKLKAYRDPVGIPTIGWGHTKGVQMGQTITISQAEEFLKEDLAVAETAIQTHVKVSLYQNQYDALVSFVFNVGSGAFKNSTLLKKLNMPHIIPEDVQAVADEFKRWVYGTVNGKKIKLNGLIRRRNEEAELFLTT